MGRLIGQVSAGGFTGMLAQRTLEKWSSTAAETLAVSLETALQSTGDPGARARLVETLGLVRPAIATRLLLQVAGDARDAEDARVAAIAALGQRRGVVGVPEALEELVSGDGRLAEVARLALIDLEAVPNARVARAEGLTIGQLFLHADIDPSLAAVGAGDNGGIATLLTANSGRRRAYQSNTKSKAGTREGAARHGTITGTVTGADGIPPAYV